MRDVLQRSVVLFVKCLAIFCITNIRLVATAPMMTKTDTMKYLNRYGYMKGDSTNMSQGLKKFQLMMHMEPTGKMDRLTSKKMQEARCGMADMKGGQEMNGENGSPTDLHICKTNRRLVATAPMMTKTDTMKYLKRYGYMKGDSTNMSQGLKKFQLMMHMEPTGKMDRLTSKKMQEARRGMAYMEGGQEMNGENGSPTDLHICKTNIRLVATAPMMTKTDTMKYLNRYGYMKGDSTNMSQGLKKFQSMMNMEPTGEMDPPTSKKMQSPRCGMADMEGGQEMNGLGWNKNNLTYRINNSANPNHTCISPPNITIAIEKAFQMWAEVVDINFTQVLGNHSVDIDIKFAKGIHDDHGVDHQNFDGPYPDGIELAHAGKPTLVNEEERGDLHFDDDETWVLNQSEPNFKATEFNFMYVAVHEIGHTLGLVHNSDNSSIMQPMYQNTTKVQLSLMDIENIQKLYMGKQSGPKSRFLGDDICDDPRIDAAFQTVNGSTYVVKENNYWKLTGTGIVKNEYPKEVDKNWRDAPDRIDAAFTNLKKDMTFFFKGSQVWRFNRSALYNQGNIKRFFNLDLDSVDAVMKGDDSKPTYFFKGNMYRKKMGPKVSSGLIKDEFKGVPNDLDAAVIYKRKDNQPPDPVFFKGDKCYYRRYSTSSTPGKAGQFTAEFIENDSKILFGCS